MSSLGIQHAQGGLDQPVNVRYVQVGSPSILEIVRGRYTSCATVNKAANGLRLAPQVWQNLKANDLGATPPHGSETPKI